MKLKYSILLTITLVLAAGYIPAGEVTFSAKPTVKKAGTKTTISFTVSEKTDVEVAILDAKGMVVRHLAAGVLGDKTPPPAPLKPGLSQTLTWDGKDDYGQAVKGGPFVARVRAGMGIKLQQIVGGDPYAFYSKQSGQGDHFQWKIAGLEAKRDGKVYLMGNTIFYGAQVIRQYDAGGEYVRTVFPPPAGKPIEEVQGWGVNTREDKSFTLKNGNGWQSSWMGNTGIAGNYGKIMVNLVPTPEKETLTLLTEPRAHRRLQFIKAGADGTLKAYQPQPFFGSVKLPQYLRGPCYTAPSPDGKSLYVSGVHSCQRKVGYGRATSVDTTGFWRDGQVWKLDRATRKMSVFFALDEKTIPGDMNKRAKAIGDMNYINPGATFHGVAVDAKGRVFVCDRLNKRIVVLDETGKLLRELPVKDPDAIGVSPKSKAVYVTTRHGNYGGRGKLELVKFNDWSKDTAPAATILLTGGIARFHQPSWMTVVEHKGQVLVWVAYTTLPVRIYRDTGSGLELYKDFYQSGLKQRVLDLKHMQLDQKTGHLYIDDTAGWCFRITDWKDPKFEVCMDDGTKKRLRASSIAIDSRNRYLYAYTMQVDKGKTRRYRLDGESILPAPVGTAGNKVTTRIVSGWGFSGLRPRGMAASPDGGLATLGLAPDKNYSANDYTGYINFWKQDSAKAPWVKVPFEIPSKKGPKPLRGGIRFDPQGNLYVGWQTGKITDIPAGYKKDGTVARATGRIVKYAPTGSLKSGCLFPVKPDKPAKVYSVRLSPIPRAYHTPRFGVDAYGRIYYPNGIECRVGVIDNEGSQIVQFGTYGNRDSTGGLEGDLVPTKDIPMSCPNSVDANDDFIYVSDMNNIRLLRLAKTFAVSETVKVK